MDASSWRGEYRETRSHSLVVGFARLRDPSEEENASALRRARYHVCARRNGEKVPTCIVKSAKLAGVTAAATSESSGAISPTAG